MWWLSLSLICLAQYAAADIYSCGGFVKSSVPIDFSAVKIKLLSPEGHLKHEEECNPQNGYYMIPVYSKGQYSLKVSAPEGWHFAENTVAVKIDGSTDPCSQNEDINFVVEAFSISGVVDDGSSAGQPGLPLVLMRDGQVIDKTTTGPSGKYSFKATPGKYEVATAKSTDACISRGAAQVEVSNKPVIVTPNLVISGYGVSVSVKQDSKVIPGVPVTVFSANDKLPNCVASKDPVAKFACSVGKTSAAGVLDLPCVPFGKYSVKAEWSQGHTSFQFSPALGSVEVKNGKASISFAVSGFSARGKVATKAGTPIAGVKVTANGKQTAVTNDQGEYDLSSLQEGSLELKAEAAHTAFKPVKTQLKLPNIQIPELIVDSYEVCGQVEKSSNGNFEVLVFKKEGTTDSLSVRPGSDGSFCKVVAPAKYTISPADVSSSLTPRSLEIDTTTGPVLGLRFTHFKTDAEARVTCIGNCGAITLKLMLGKTVVQQQEGADVVFRDIGPGKYNVVLDDNGRGCWESREMALSVEHNRPAITHFVQNGFVTNVKLSHKAHLRWNHSDKKQLRGDVEATGGVTSICVPVQGRYQIAIESCFSFSPGALEISVPSDSIAEAHATDARISGTVKSSDNAPFTIKIKSAAGEREIPVTKGSFTFQEPLSTSGDVVLVPSSPVYLFEPHSSSLTFKGECIDAAASFVGEKGNFVDGRIEPAVEGVQIVAVNNKDSNVKLSAVSDKKGQYRIGPVRRADDFTISASLDGYSFSNRAGSLGVIDCVKLSKLSVILEDIDSKSRLEDVLLSVVGGTNYRSNIIVDATGEINFVGLAPGEYFVRPILQEYKFEPSTRTIVIKEGEHEHLLLQGKRVSYSAFGKVREMSKAPVAGVTVEALSEECEQHQSEAVTLPNGQFRIRGLRPGCQYKVSPKSGADSSSPPHCFPASFSVKMPSRDVKGLEMVAAPRDISTMLAVEIDFGTVPLPSSYRVSVSRAGSVIYQSTIQSPVTVFYYNEIERDGQEYSVRIEPDRPANAFKPKTVFFTADSAVRVVRVPITTSQKSSDVEISISSILALPFFGLVALAFLNQNKALEMVNSFVAQLRAASGAGDRRKRRS